MKRLTGLVKNALFVSMAMTLLLYSGCFPASSPSESSLITSSFSESSGVPSPSSETADHLPEVNMSYEEYFGKERLITLLEEPFAPYQPVGTTDEIWAGTDGKYQVIWEDEAGLSLPCSDGVLLFFVRGGHDICRVHLPSGRLDLLATSAREVIALDPLTNRAVRWYVESQEWEDYLAAGGSPIDEDIPRDLILRYAYFTSETTGESERWNYTERGDFVYQGDDGILIDESVHRLSDDPPIRESNPYWQMSYEEYFSEERPLTPLQFGGRWGPEMRVDKAGDLTRRYPTGETGVVFPGLVIDFRFIDVDRILVATEDTLIEMNLDGSNQQIVAEESGVTQLYDVTEEVIYFFKDENRTLFQLYRPSGRTAELMTLSKPVRRMFPRTNLSIAIEMAGETSPRMYTLDPFVGESR